MAGELNNITGNSSLSSWVFVDSLYCPGMSCWQLWDFCVVSTLRAGTSGRPVWRHSQLPRVFSSTPHSFWYIGMEPPSSPGHLSTPRRKTVSGELFLFAPTRSAPRKPETFTQRLTRYKRLWHTRWPPGFVNDAQRHPTKFKNLIGLLRFHTSWTIFFMIIRSSPRLLH